MEKGHYTEQDKKNMFITAKARNSSRMQELLNYLNLNHYKKVGIANCFSVNRYADKLREILEQSGFEVSMVNCKESQLPSTEISSELQGISCDPKSQAEYLNAQKTDLNIEFGLCLGHGIIFQQYSQAPVTTLMIKDPIHQHCIMENFL